MAFDPELDSAYDEGIKPAVTEDCQFSVIRVDRVEHNDNINDRIIGEIRGCQFIVADFTLHRNRVYFEAGFAAGLGRPVVWTCRKDQMRDAHFDTRPYNHIVWEDPVQLRQRLGNRIRPTILQ
jgi:nucleoside 2-deoxyribosyltransferase